MTKAPGSPGPCLVREGGVEPPHPFGHTDLNRARLPIPPLALSPCRQDGLQVTWHLFFVFARHLAADQHGGHEDQGERGHDGVLEGRS